ncbi:hypothetical protein ACN2EN_10920 [Aliarcobacter lanthieri]|uniref:hypothetical protein n=1 Tax=Aliarcobacter lanthieri TaxID=1355374 RepID=UPI00047CF6B8|nr:hypothetical protein [Aliarcobacter lanthieri]
MFGEIKYRLIFSLLTSLLILFIFISEKIDNPDFIGFKDNYAGFLYIEDGGSPEEYSYYISSIKFI